MTTDEKQIMDETLKAFLDSVTKVLGQHAEALKRIADSIARLEANQTLENADLKAVAAEVNKHGAILSSMGFGGTQDSAPTN